MDFNLTALHEAIAAEHPERTCIIQGDRRLSYADVDSRSRRLASALAANGVGLSRERAQLANHESGQDHVALYLQSCPEYLEGMLGAMKARAAPFNVNHRYVAEELAYVLNDAAPKVAIYHDEFASTLADVLPGLPSIELLVQVTDSTGADLLPGAIRYDDFISGTGTSPSDIEPSGDDLYMLYTGGTTGMPKGVLWRQHDVFVAAMGGRPWGQSAPFDDIDSVVAASANGGARMMTAAPLMHGAAQWLAFTAFTGGNTVVLPADPGRFDPAAIWSTVEQEKVLTLQIVGDAFGRPLVDELDRHDYDLSNFMVLSNGGAALGPTTKERLLERLPNLMLIDAIGSSETGGQMGNTSTATSGAQVSFAPGPGTVVVDDSMSAVLEPGGDTTGWLAQSGNVPLGYLGDADKTARTFPTIDGIRYAIPGDRAIIRADGDIEFRGRESATINTGGEKVFAEEVERSLLNHRSVLDVMVVGRPSERWGSEVVAIVELADDIDDAELLETASRHLARYKLPKAIIRKDRLRRSPAGKADYRWAASVAAADAEATVSAGE